MTHEKRQWFELIKVLRCERSISIFEAERSAVTSPKWRRWVKRQINNDRKCRRLALAHMKRNGPESLIVIDGSVLRVSEQ